MLEQKGFPWNWERRLIEHYHPGHDKLWRRVRSNYCGMLRLIDDQLKRLVGYLESSGLSERTHLLFVADHGDFVGDYGLIRKGVGLAECLIRIPFVWSGPGVLCGAEPDASVCHVDVFPTVCDMLDVQIPEGVQGRSLLPILTGRDYPPREFESMYAEYGFGGLQWTDAGEDGFTWDQTFIKASGESEHRQDTKRIPVTFDELNSITQSGHVKMVRKGDWKLIYTFMGDRELYNLKSDPAELKNLINDEALHDVREELELELIHWLVRIQDQLPLDRYKMKRAPRNYIKED
jgi:arylsulfatase A-like enzyme